MPLPSIYRRSAGWANLVLAPEPLFRLADRAAGGAGSALLAALETWSFGPSSIMIAVPPRQIANYRLRIATPPCSASIEPASFDTGFVRCR